MPAAIFKAEIDFSSGASFDPSLVLDDPSTPLDFAVLGDVAADVVDITSYVTQCYIRRAFNRSSDGFTGGVARIVFVDQTGEFNPANTGSSLYGKIKPMRKVRFTAEYLGVTYSLGSMYVQEWNYQSPTGFDPAYVTLACVDGFQLLNLTTITSVSGGTAGQTTAQRISSLLNAGDWPGAMRDISTTATTTVQADVGTSRSLLAACQEVEATDLGAFYMDQRGYATFLSRTDIISASGGTQTAFSDVPGSGDVTYQATQFDISDYQMINKVTVTPTGLTGQTASDTVSIDDYFQHSRVRTGIMQTEADALNQAQMIIASRKEQGVDIQLNSLTVDAYGENDPNRVVAALNLDMFDPIEVTQTLPAGNVVTDSVIAGLTYEITPKSFLVTFTCAQPFASGFVLNSIVDGKLDEDSLAY
ncbi:hypothetical protein UFOVP432_8 [uncultured Caudovirales phage]|uniref:Uncharacterized protein n=1 Tax=uncultured Caudovirales phage TaxID=2100421 RepID=A0A6J5MIQ0_9CAUD|nr:hypothetical protein UFOVP432_8 [uncultured Caudovirales phage]